MSRLMRGAVLATLTLLPLATAEVQASSEPLYTITLTAIAAVDEPHVVAAQIAAAAGGTIETVTEGTVTMRLAPSRARVVAADPRVQSIAPRTDAGSMRKVGSAAETMTWSAGVTYDYDDSGNVRQIGTDTFVYDTVGRLVQSHTNGIPRNYEYDAFGNRTKCREAEGTAEEGDCQNGYTINPANNRLENTTYDAAGNVTGLGAHVYSYDALNMQTRDAWGALVREYIYTADDERIAVYEVGQRWRWTVRDTSGKVLREFTSTNPAGGSLGTANWKWTKDYVWRGGLLLASRQMEGSAVTTYHYHLDHLGTPRRITDATDRIVGIHDYFPFGTEQSGAQNEPSLSLMKFTGHERDIVGSESWDTLDYMHARYESPSMGRFLSIDPVLNVKKAARSPQQWNRYSYVMNNPLKYTDPTGEVAFLMGTDEETRRMLATIKYGLNNNEAAKHLSKDKFNRLTVTGMSAADWGKKFGGNAAKLASIMQSSHKVGIGFQSGSEIEKMGGAAHLGVSKNYSQVLINESSFPRETYGTMQWIDTTLAHELFGHALRTVGGIKEDVGSIHYGMQVLHGINPAEADGMWAENNYRAAKGLPLRPHYKKPGDYIPPKD